MIQKHGPYDYRLSCDYCEEECDEIFETFEDAVDYKTDKDNGWKSIKDKNNDWLELCPTCKTPEIIAKLKGVERDVAKRSPRAPVMDPSGLEFEGF